MQALPSPPSTGMFHDMQLDNMPWLCEKKHEAPRLSIGWWRHHRDRNPNYTPGCDIRLIPNQNADQIQQLLEEYRQQFRYFSF